MLTEEKLLNLAKEAGLNEKKFRELVQKEDPSFGQLLNEELDNVSGGIGQPHHKTNKC